MHNLNISIQNKKTPGFGASYTIRPGNGVRLFYSPRPTWGTDKWIGKTWNAAY